VAIWQHRKRVLGTFSPRMRRNGYLWTSGQKSDPAIRSGDLDFLYDKCISTTEWRLLDIFNVFVLLRRMQRRRAIEALEARAPPPRQSGDSG